MFKKVLIANRGEIALRVQKTARDLGIQTVAVYSTADRRAPHVLFADEAVHIGPPTSSASYLNIDRIIQAALDTGAEAIHPGYGFLSENPVFARAVRDAGLTFIGPSAESIEIMGSKLRAREAVSAFSIPLVPGTGHAISDVEKAKKVAREIGFPILIKASAGGGGKGMRLVYHETEFEEQMDRAVSEATKAFGDPSVFIEKYIARPKHIEIQVFADTQGNCIHFFERDCSIQRRHQKVIEEAPSPIVDADLRERMGADAVRVAKACAYVGAGTVEFLVDVDKNYYFLEMNTRLQVEHPVTELITGHDLVALQFQVAAGHPLPIVQGDLSIKGHAIELRVYAEDPYDNFLPSTGRLEQYRHPEGPGIRVDDGYAEGLEVPVHYDPLLAKLIAYGQDRQQAIHRLREAIEAYAIEGVKSTLPFGTFVLEHPEFADGHYDTHFVSTHFDTSGKSSSDSELEELAAVLSAKVMERYLSVLKVPGNR